MRNFVDNIEIKNCFNCMFCEIVSSINLSSAWCEYSNPEESKPFTIKNVHTSICDNYQERII